MVMHNIDLRINLLMLVKVLVQYKHMIYKWKFCSMSSSKKINFTNWTEFCLLNLASQSMFKQAPHLSQLTEKKLQYTVVGLVRDFLSYNKMYDYS